jgi:hypothetical protein
MTTPPEGAAKTKAKPRRRTVIGTVLAGLGVVVGALWGLDAWARQQVADIVTEKVEQLLSLESDHPVTVEIAGVSVIAQVLTGSLEQVDVGVDDVTIGEFEGGVALRAEGIPVDLSKPVDRVQIEFSVSEQSIQKIAHVLSATAIDRVTLAAPEIQFASEMSVLGFSLDVGVGVEPFAEDGRVGFTPSSVELNGNRTSAASMVERYGVLAELLFESRSVCVARWLPVALTVDSVAVRDDDLVLTIGADKGIFTDAELRRLGSCR